MEEPKKIYLHFEEDADNSKHFTVVCFIKAGMTVGEVIDYFVARSKLDQTSAGSLNADYLILNSCDDFKTFGAHSENIYNVCSNGEDILVRITPISQRVQIEPAQATKGINSSPAYAKSNPKPKKTVDPEELARRRIEIRNLVNSKSFRRSRELCESLLAEYPNDAAVLTFLVESYLGAEKVESAISTAERAIKLVSGDGKLYYLLGKALSAQGNPDEAEIAFKKAQHLVEKNAGDFPRDFLLEVAALLAESVYDSGRHNEAAQIVNALVTTPSGFGNIHLLFAYARFAAEYDKVEEPMQALLKAVTIDQKNIRVNALLSKLLSSERGILELMKQVPPSGNPNTVSQAYAYLASIARDRSVFTASKTLLAIALQKRPNFPSYALNLAHVYENTCDLSGALAVIIQFFRDNSTLRIGKHGPTCSQLADATESSNSNSSSTDQIVSRKYLNWVDNGNGDGYCEVIEANSDDCITASSIPSIQTVVLDDNDLDLLAIGFTAVKVLYHIGDIGLIPNLVELLEPIRRASSVSIHLTTIRNENAYYQCIMQVLSSRPYLKHFCGNSPQTESPSFATLSAAYNRPEFEYAAATRNPIYFCGDSHTIPAAWNIITVQGTQRMLVPKLVTGVKQWHLRKESDFYPKAHFFNTIKTIPDRSDVIFNIGEIDCREGLLLALERDKYRSLEEGMEVVIKIFVGVLQDIIKKKKFKVYIHPVVPVLKETRPQVLLFNRIYKKIVSEKLKDATWLSFEDDLLVPGTLELNPVYSLDGTHLHPSYLNLIEIFLNTATSAV